MAWSPKDPFVYFKNTIKTSNNSSFPVGKKCWVGNFSNFLGRHIEKKQKLMILMAVEVRASSLASISVDVARLSLALVGYLGMDTLTLKELFIETTHLSDTRWNSKQR